MVLGAGHPSSWDGVWRGAKFVGREFLHAVWFSVEDTDVRAEELVGGADKEVAIPGLDIDTTVGGVVDGIDEQFSAGVVNPFSDGWDIGEGADSV